MGILNITPDSFFDGGKFNSKKKAIKHVEMMIENGADIIDIGAVSSRPFSKNISFLEEKNRLFPYLNEIIKKFPDIILSVDTFRSEIAKIAIESGATIINDIYGGNYDKNMFNYIAKNNIPYILMHMKGKPSNMQKNIFYKNFEEDILNFFKRKKEELVSLGHNN